MGSRLVALGFGVALSFIVLEGLLRLVPAAIPQRLLARFEPGLRAQIAEGTLPLRSDFVRIERDDDGPPLYVPRPGSAVISADARETAGPRHYDEIGFCNPPGLYDENASFDVIAVGDSFTWCHAVRAEQAWALRLGDRSGHRSYNLGQGGIGLYEYVQLLRRFGVPKHPAAVVLNVYGGNDLRDALHYHEFREALRSTGREPESEPETLWPGLRHGWLGRHGYAVNLGLAYATSVWQHASDGRSRGDENLRYTIDTPAGPLPFNVRNRDTDEIEYARRLRADPSLLELWDEALSAFVALSRETGFEPVVVYTPSAHAVYAGRVRFADPELRALLTGFDRAQREFLARRAAELGYAFHDLLPDLRAAAEGGDALLYDPDHLHFTPLGHERVAASVGRFLALVDGL